MLTMTKLEMASPEGIKFLKRVLKLNENWAATASPSTDWNLSFSRIVKAKDAGDTDEEVIVRTDVNVGYNKNQFGELYVERDSASEKVYIPNPRYMTIHYSGEMMHLCESIQRGMHLSIECSRGSINSSKLGIGHVYLKARKGDLSFIIGHETLLQNGRTLESGNVSV